MKFSIIYEDNHLLVVEKPRNVLIQGDDTKDVDLLTLLKNDLKERYNKPGNVYLGLVHRLDRPVGGAIVFAKTSKAASRLSNLIREHQLERQYLAVVRGIPYKKKGTLKHYLLKDEKKNKVFVVPKGTKKAKLAELDYEVLKSSEGLSLLKVRLHTGRPHQIRVQLSTEGYLLYGDQKYGQYVNKVGQQIALWSYSLKFLHPVKKEIVEFHCEPPKEYPWNLFFK